jgi:endonuclease/exonuclease/phosphatase family metal-dependent hydrolase
MRIFKRLLQLVLFLIIAFCGFVGYIIITDYAPEDIEAATVLRDNETAVTGMTFTLTTFNIGYCGLDKDQDFFLDGGTMSHSSSKEKTLENLEGVKTFIDEQNSDFYFLQEVDEKGSRSFNVNQKESILNEFLEYSATYSYNFKAKWIPIPVTDPLGSAYSGLMNLSRFSPVSSTRYKLPGEEPFPKKYFELDRSVMEDVYLLENGKSLYMINLHLSAYDKGGNIRAEQVQFLIEYINEIYDDGENYIIFGGDWNHLLDSSKFTDDLPGWVATLPEDLFDTGFNLAYDTNTSTVRSDETAYVEGTTFETVIDGFLVSPNITIDLVEGGDLGFEYSDHNPVTLTFTLNE